MSTTALIGMTTPERQVRFITCYMDGYPRGAGKMLAEHWRTRDKDQTLIELGNIKSLGASPGSSRISGWNDHEHSGPSRPDAGTAGGIEEFLDMACSHHDSSWAYLFTDNGWLAAPTRFIGVMTALEPLEQLLAEPA